MLLRDASDCTHYLVPIPRHAFILATLLVGCAAEVTPGDSAEGDGRGDGGGEVGPIGPTACGGALTTTPRTLATGLEGGELHQAGDLLILAQYRSGRILSIDRCSGDTSVLAELGEGAFVGYHFQVAIFGADVVAAVATPTSHRLVRVPLVGGEPVVVADLPASAKLVAHAGRLSALIEVQDDGAGGWPDQKGVFDVDLDRGTVTETSRFETANGGSSALAGASEAGLYVTSHPHGGEPSLRLVPIDGGDASALDNTWSVTGVAVSDRSLIVVSDPIEDDYRLERALVRMSLAGDDA